jgi:uncharacterized C2H2 Zn-finger protein
MNITEIAGMERVGLEWIYSDNAIMAPVIARVDLTGDKDREEAVFKCAACDKIKPAMREGIDMVQCPRCFSGLCQDCFAKASEVTGSIMILGKCPGCSVLWTWEKFWNLEEREYEFTLRPRRPPHEELHAIVSWRHF